MKTITEITEWNLDYTIPGHTYFVSDSKDKAFAYIKAGSNTIEEFNKPYRFSTSGRKFKEINNIWGFFPKEETVEGFVKIAIGSKGEKYTITEVAGMLQCSCPGFKFRGKCRHIES
jgi:hypothetical protein